MSRALIDFHKRVLFVGFGSVAQCTLPILLKHLRVPLQNITVLDFEDQAAAAAAVDRPGRPLRPRADHAGEPGRSAGRVPGRRATC